MMKSDESCRSQLISAESDPSDNLSNLIANCQLQAFIREVSLCLSSLSAFLIFALGIKPRLLDSEVVASAIKFHSCKPKSRC